MRLGAIFVATCMVLIAGSTGAVAYLTFGLNPSEAMTIALAVLTAFALYGSLSSRMAARAMAGNELAALSRDSADLAWQVAEVGRRLAVIESGVKITQDKTRAATDPLAAEIGELGALLNQLADTVAVHETTLMELGRSNAAFVAPIAEAMAESLPAAIVAVPEAPPASVPEPLPAAVAAADSAGPPQHEMRALIRDAIDASRVDLYLQPIVTLPQRKVRFYEALSRLRTAQGEILPAADFIATAQDAALMPKIDNLMVFRCVQVVRRLLLKNREVGLFCNLSGSTLTDATVFQQLFEFLEANRAIAPSLVLEFTQDFLRNAGPMENESLSALADRGFRFSLDNLRDLRLEPRELGQRGFRFVKVPASLLLNHGGAATTDIHPADLSDLLGRFGIDLIAEKIESEGSVVDLLDCDVRYGQGFLFSSPRPVRAEALQGIPDRGDLVTPDAISDGAKAAVASMSAAAVSTRDMGNGKRAPGIAQLARRV
jgi:cyclic-di-GMP phosphodiesterase TipF (flagellum assembly factor)